eukprot:6365052-Amphidinium_carterae.2
MHERSPAPQAGCLSTVSCLAAALPAQDETCIAMLTSHRRLIHNLLAKYHHVLTKVKFYKH